MKFKRLLSSMLSFMFILPFIFPQLVSAQEVKENAVASTKIEVIAEQSLVYNMQGVEVGQLLEGIELSVIDQDDDKVYIQWGKERAYLFEDTVKFIASDEANTAETDIKEEGNTSQETFMQEMARTIPFKASDKYFEPTERLTVYDNSSGSLVFVGYLDPGQSFPRIRDYGDWHEIKYRNGTGYVWKASTKPSTAVNIKNLNPGLKNNDFTVKAKSVLSVYDNSSGVLVPFASINKDVSYPVISEMGDWYKIDVAGRIGHIYKPATSIIYNPATIKDFVASDKYFEPTERVTVYDNSTGSLVFVGYLDPGQSFPRIRDYGDWHEIKYGNGTGYVWKASTKPSTVSGIKNINSGLKNNGVTVKASSVLSVYDNSSGALVQFASLNKDVSYPVISEMGDWYKIDVAGRIGHIYKPATTVVKTLGLKGKTIVIDPGHGGTDSGTIGTSYGTYEKTIALSTALILSDLLKKAGANVVMTRSTDVFIPLPGRVAISHSTNADAFVSVHYNNAGAASAASGIETYHYYARDKALADSIHKELIAKTGLKNRKVKFGNYHVLRENQKPSVLLELGFLSNRQEEGLVRTHAYHTTAATAVYKGLEKYFANK